jgi:hypothetical protein
MRTSSEEINRQRRRCDRLRAGHDGLGVSLKGARIY